MTVTHATPVPTEFTVLPQLAGRGFAAEGAACAVICAGTSRIMAVLQEEVPAGPLLDEALLDLVLGDHESDGLGLNHYQGNKVVVVSRAQGPARFGFRFHQIDRESRSVIANLECGNAGAAAGLFAILHGLAGPDATGRLRAVNLGTGQELELSVPGDPFDRASPWVVAFVHARDLLLSASWFEPHSLAHVDGRSVDYWVAERGNVFVLANAAPEAAEPELIGELVTHGREIALTMGLPARRANVPKVILYGVREPAGPIPEVDAVCFFRGELHHSLPGSGAMCLATFLALGQLDLVRPVAPAGWGQFLLRHPSGVLSVRVRWERTGDAWRVVRTEFRTPVRMLLSGTAVGWPAERAHP